PVSEKTLERPVSDESDLPSKFWEELNSAERDRIGQLISHLAEFWAGFQHLGQLAPNFSNQNHPLHRFMQNALHQHFHAFYLAGERGVQDVLRSINLEYIADQIDEILNRPLGSRTFRAYITERR